MLSGIVFGCLCVFIIMIFFGHYGYYTEALGEAFNTLSHKEATHSQGELLIRYFRSFSNLIIQTVILTAIGTQWIRSKRMSYKLRIMSRAALTILIMILVKTSLPYLTLLASCTLIIIIAYRSRLHSDNSHIMVIYLLAATLLFPIGSDIGLQGIFNWCVGLLVFPASYCISKIKNKEITYIAFTVYICICIGAIAKTGYKAYGESRNRTQCTCMIQESRLNVYTDSIKARRYKQAIKAIKEHTDKSRLMILANQASELYYATMTYPFLGHTQTIIYTGDMLSQRIDERYNSLGHLPLIVFLELEQMPYYERNNRNILISWMQRHGYSVVYQDGFTTIYKSNQPTVNRSVKDRRKI